MCQKGSYTCTGSRDAFHCHLIATQYINHMICVCITEKVKRSVLIQASFPTLYDVQKCSGGLLIAPSPFDKQSQTAAGCKSSPHDWLISLGMDTKFCVIHVCRGEKSINECHLNIFRHRHSLSTPLHGLLPTPTLQKYYLKWLAIQLFRYSELP